MYTWSSLLKWIPKSLEQVTTSDIRHYFNRSFKICELYNKGGNLQDVKILQTERKQAGTKRFHEAQKQKLKADQMLFAQQCLKQFAAKKQSRHRNHTTRKLDQGLDSYKSDLFG